MSWAEFTALRPKSEEDALLACLPVARCPWFRCLVVHDGMAAHPFQIGLELVLQWPDRVVLLRTAVAMSPMYQF